MIYNFRDLGGLQTKCQRQVKPGLVFRTGNLSHLDTPTGRFLAEDKKLRVYIDFRSQEEIRHFGRPDALIENQIEWINLEVDTRDERFEKLTHPTAQDWVDLYKKLFENNVGVWIKFLHILAEADAPVAYGCLFGKDRTGIASSILLEALNVHDNLITKNYSETTQHIEPLYRKFEALWQKRGLSEEEIFRHYLTASEDIMTDFILHLRQQLVTEEAKLLLEHVPFDTRTKLQLRLLG